MFTSLQRMKVNVVILCLLLLPSLGLGIFEIDLRGKSMSVKDVCQGYNSLISDLIGNTGNCIDFAIDFPFYQDSCMLRYYISRILNFDACRLSPPNIGWMTEESGKLKMDVIESRLKEIQIDNELHEALLSCLPLTHIQHDKLQETAAFLLGIANPGEQTFFWDDALAGPEVERNAFSFCLINSFLQQYFSLCF